MTGKIPNRYAARLSNALLLLLLTLLPPVLVALPGDVLANHSEDGEEYTVPESKAWYSKYLRLYFKEGLIINGSDTLLSSILATSHDITVIETELVYLEELEEKVTEDKAPEEAPEVEAEGERGVTKKGGKVALKGTVKIGELPPPFEVLGRGAGKRYMVYVNAYILNEEKIPVWSGYGYPDEKLWLKPGGDEFTFLIDGEKNFKDEEGSRLLILVTGDPIFNSSDGSTVTKVILGALFMKI